MSTQDLFGLRSGDLESAREVVEKAFGLELEPHDSSYYGGDYYRRRLENQDELILQINDDGNGWAEEDYKDYGVLLSIYSTTEGDRYSMALASADSGFVPLERSVTMSRVLRRMRYIDGRESVYFEKQLDASEGVREAGVVSSSPDRDFQV